MCYLELTISKEHHVLLDETLSFVHGLPCLINGNTNFCISSSTPPILHEYMAMIKDLKCDRKSNNVVGAMVVSVGVLGFGEFE